MEYSRSKQKAEFHVDELVKLGYLNRTTHRNQFFIVTGYFVPEVEIFPTKQKEVEHE